MSKFFPSLKIANDTKFLLIMSHTRRESRVLPFLLPNSTKQMDSKKNGRLNKSFGSYLKQFSYKFVSVLAVSLRLSLLKLREWKVMLHMQNKQKTRKKPFKSSCHSNGAAKDEKSLNDFLASCDKLNFSKSSQAQALELSLRGSSTKTTINFR